MIGPWRGVARARWSTVAACGRAGEQIQDQPKSTTGSRGGGGGGSSDSVHSPVSAARIWAAGGQTAGVSVDVGVESFLWHCGLFNAVGGGGVDPKHLAAPES